MLTPELSAAIFQKDLANIIAKTRDGKPLAATERRVLRSVPATGEPLPDVGLTITALNEATGADRRTLKKILYDVTPVGVHANGNSLHPCSSKTATTPPDPSPRSSRRGRLCVDQPGHCRQLVISSGQVNEN